MVVVVLALELDPFDIERPRGLLCNRCVQIIYIQ